MFGILNMESVFVDGAKCWFCIAFCQWVCFTSRLIYVGKDRAVLKSVLGKETHNMFMWFWAHSIFALQGVCVRESRGSVVWYYRIIYQHISSSQVYRQQQILTEEFCQTVISVSLYRPTFIYKKKRKSSDGPQHSWWEQWMGLSRLTRILLMMSNEDFNYVFVVSMIDIFTFARISTLPFWAFFPATPQKSKTNPWSA